MQCDAYELLLRQATKRDE